LNPASRSDSGEHQDFITAEPEPILFIGRDQAKLFEKHGRILKALITEPLTVKEIHAIFTDPNTQKPTKTIKTVYRHLDQLEAAGLVKVAGHRKPKDSRLVEKLYCRAARIFVTEEEGEGAKWWRTKQGKTLLRNLSTVCWEFFQVAEADTTQFRKLMLEFFAFREKTTKKLFRMIQGSESLTELFGKADIEDIKFLVELVGLFGVLVKKPEILDQLQTVLRR
jgi:hypothetical protein